MCACTMISIHKEARVPKRLMTSALGLYASWAEQILKQIRYLGVGNLWYTMRLFMACQKVINLVFVCLIDCCAI